MKFTRINLKKIQSLRITHECKGAVDIPIGIGAHIASDTLCPSCKGLLISGTPGNDATCAAILSFIGAIDKMKTWLHWEDLQETHLFHRSSLHCPDRLWTPSTNSPHNRMHSC